MFFLMLPLPEFNVAEMFRKAFYKTGWKLEAAAAQIGVDPSDISKQLNGIRPIQHAKFAQLGPEFLAALGTEFAHGCGLEVAELDPVASAIGDLLRACGLATEKLQMAKAHLEDKSARRTA